MSFWQLFRTLQIFGISFWALAMFLAITFNLAENYAEITASAAIMCVWLLCIIAVGKRNG